MKKLFITIESIIYLTFIIFDLFHINSIYLKYLGIFLCFLFAFLNKKKYISNALLFTLIADYFLLIKDEHYLIGVSSFLLVQTIYFFYLKNNNCELFKKVRVLIYALILTFSIIFKLDVLYFLVLIYFSTLVLNTVSSFTSRDLRIFSIGLTLFILCDVSVGLFNILPYGRVYLIVSLLMWVFYLPSQVLISLSKV